jgi:D-tyrosyl-tRNA(Tyr) deacylase
MSPPRKAVYFFCCDPARDPVAHRVFDAVLRLQQPEATEIVIDGQPVLRSTDEAGDAFYYVRLDEVLSVDYPRYLPVLEQHLSAFDFAGIINWHEGRNAPDAILTVHTTGDMVSGYFGPADPRCTRNLLLAIEENRRECGLDGFVTTSEATHWSGIVYGGAPELIPRYPVPLVDIEIGSTPESWSNRAAAEVLARSLTRVFGEQDAEVRSLLCVGGAHFEPAFSAAVLHREHQPPLAVSHILANQWLGAGAYDSEPGYAKLEACARSIRGGLHAIAFHDGIRGRYKAQLRRLGEQLGIPAFKHQALQEPEDLSLPGTAASLQPLSR